jgi:hypothetical protein
MVYFDDQYFKVDRRCMRKCIASRLVRAYIILDATPRWYKVRNNFSVCITFFALYIVAGLVCTLVSGNTILVKLIFTSSKANIFLITVIKFLIYSMK